VASPVTVERVDFVVVPTRDLAQAHRFYGELLGLPAGPVQRDTYQEFETSNVTLGFYRPEAMGREFSPTAGIAVRVPNVEEARQALEAAGVAFEGETIDSGVCHMAFCTDFDGNGVVIHRRYAPRG
jgi:predicted enzyme related to lactoylglutathione lyase